MFIPKSQRHPQPTRSFKIYQVSNDDGDDSDYSLTSFVDFDAMRLRIESLSSEKEFLMNENSLLTNRLNKVKILRTLGSSSFFAYLTALFHPNRSSS